MASVGIRTLGWKGSRRVFAGGRMRKACWFEIVAHELHPTKGWRFLRRVRKAVPEHDWNKAPASEQRFERNKPPRDRSPPIRLSEPAMETARLRHDWYRRQKEGSVSAGVTDRLWSTEDIVALLEARDERRAGRVKAYA